MRKPLVYVAGPYTKPDPVQNTHLAIRVGMWLYETGLCAVIVPHTTLLMHMVSPRPEAFWYEFDLTQLAHCDALFRMPGESVGADREVVFAREHGIPVFDDLELLTDWLRGKVGGSSCSVEGQQ